MDFGLFLEFPRWDGGTEQEAFQRAFRLVDMAEQLGVDSVWLAEYHFSEGRVLASPITIASAIAARTQRVRIGLSVPQVASVLFALVSITIIDIFMFRGSKTIGETKWGKIPAISQYILIFIAATFTWLMGLMGYVRSGLRQHWHVYGVIRDTSPDAFTPTLGFATKVVSVNVLLFFVLIGFVFWLASLSGKKDWEPSGGDT